jgi:F-type H+-transporting ATPase subunit gamma
MAQIREIKKRIVAVKTIRRITKTMQMIATAKFTASLSRAKASRPYMERIRELVAEVAARAGDVSHPLCQPPQKVAKKELILVVASDRGLCGAYNGHVLRTAMKAIRAAREAGREPVVEVVGKKAIAFFKFQKIAVAQRHAFGDKPQFEAVEVLANRLIQDYLAGGFDACRVVFMKFVSNSRQVPETLQLLPLNMAAAEAGAPGAGGASLYEFMPNAQELLGELLPRTLKVSLFQAIIDAIVSENVMRMVAMKSATDNAAGLGRTLNRSYNRARQARITTELTEIVSGAAALE